MGCGGQRFKVVSDWCHSADDVQVAIRLNREFRERMFALPLPPPVQIESPPMIEEPQQPEPTLPAPPPEPPPVVAIEITMNRITESVSRHFGLRRYQHKMLYGKCRQHHVTDVRHVIFVLIRALLPRKSLPEIGRHFHRDHTTILHGVRLYDATIGDLQKLDSSSVSLDNFVERAVDLMRHEAGNGRRQRTPKFLKGWEWP